MATTTNMKPQNDSARSEQPRLPPHCFAARTHRTNQRGNVVLRTASCLGSSRSSVGRFSAVMIPLEWPDPSTYLLRNGDISPDGFV